MATFFVCDRRRSTAHVKRFTNAVNKVQESAGASERLQELLDEPRRHRRAPRRACARRPGRGPALRGRDASPTRAASAPALERLTLDVRPGETLALVGPSGAGKTHARRPDRALHRSRRAGASPSTATTCATSRSTPGRRMYAMVGQMPFLFHTSIAREHPLRQARRDAGRGRGGRARRATSTTSSRALPAGLRHERRRRGLAPLRRPAPAHHDRARDPQGRAAAPARRGDERARQRVRGRGAGGARAPDGATAP